MEKLPHVEKVAFRLGVKCGSVYESKRLSGAVHFTEHMLFKSNKYRTYKEIKQDPEYKGTEINAFTDQHMITFEAKSFPSYLDDVVDVIFEAITNFEYKTDELEKEREVILEEIYESDCDESGYLHDRVFRPALFKGTAYERSILGTKESVSNVIKEELENFKREFFVPNNIIITAAGNFNKRKLIRKIRKTFATLERKEIPQIDLNIDLANKHQIILKEMEGLKRAYLNVGAKIPILDEDTYKLILIETILGGPASARLYEELRDQNNICYDPGFCLVQFEECGYFRAFINSFDPERFDEALGIILNEFKKLKTELVPVREFEGMKNNLLFEISDCFEDSEGCASTLLSSETKEEAYEYREYKKKIGKITREDIIDTANKYLTDECLVAALVPPGFKAK